MSFSIITADQRLAEQRGIKGCIFGKPGIGKTHLIKTLNPATTLFFDLEAGDLAIGDWPVDTIRPRKWEDCRKFALFIGGGNPALAKEHPYSEESYKELCKDSEYGSPDILKKYDTIFIDSITVAGRLCFGWCSQQKKEITTTAGNIDTRKIYGLHGQEMMAWLTHLQHTRNKNIWFVGILDEKFDDFNRRYYQPQIEGSKTGLELPGIVDQVITMAQLKGTKKDEQGKDVEVPYRALVCHTMNPYDYPAKDRSGKLDCIEEPDLGALMNKIIAPKKLT